MYLLIVIVILMIITVLLKISIAIEFLKTGEKGENDTVIVSASTLKNLIKFKFSIGGKKKSKLRKAPQKKKIRFSFSKMTDTVEKAYQNYYLYKDVLLSVRNFIRKKLICSQLVFHMEFGLSDAAVTGMASGVIWGTVYNILAVIDSLCILKETDIKITPDFNELKMNIRLYCIFEFRIVHIITVFFMLLWAFLKQILNNNTSIINKQKAV